MAWLHGIFPWDFPLNFPKGDFIGMSGPRAIISWDFPYLVCIEKIAIEIVDLPIKNGDLVGFNGIY